MATVILGELLVDEMESEVVARSSVGVIVVGLFAVMLFYALTAVGNLNVTAVPHPQWGSQDNAAAIEYDTPWPNMVDRSGRDVGEIVFQMVRADGSVSMRIDMSGMDMPDFPDCKELGVEFCEWEAHLVENPGGNRLVEVTAKDANGEVIGHTQFLEVQNAEFEQLHSLVEANQRTSWLSHIQVAKHVRMNGVGRTMFNAGSQVLKEVAGPLAVHTMVDQAGWGQALMANINTFIVNEAPVWAFFVKEVAR